MPNIHNSGNCGTKRQYIFRPIKGKTITFKLKTNANGNICLSPTASETPHHQFEIFLAGWGGGDSGIRRNKKDDVSKVKTPDLLNKNEFRGFWITLENYAIKMGKEGNPQPFLIHQDPLVRMDFSYYGYCTSYGSTGQWIFNDDDYPQGGGFDMGGIGDALPGIYPSVPGFNPPHGKGMPPSYPSPPAPHPAPPPPYSPPAQPTSFAGIQWVSCQALAMCPAPVPVVPGTTNSYVAIAYHAGALIPGCLSAPSLNCCHISWGGQAYPKTDFFLLSNPTNVELAWQQAKGGSIPVGAIQGGYSENGEQLYIGRFRETPSFGSRGKPYLCGKVHPSHRVCYAPSQGREVANASYEVLCLKTVPLSLLGL